MSEPIYLLDRSGGELDDTCGMAFWYNRLEHDHGIVPIDRPDYFQDGINIHDDLSTVAEMELSRASIEDLISHILSVNGDLTIEQKETLYRRAGWVAAFALFVEPRIRAEFENVSTEAELILDRDPLWVPVTPDRVLCHREGRYLVYKEYKSTITAGAKWASSWPYQIQLHIGMKAIEEELNEPVAYSQIIGLLKGDRRGDHLLHPYVWGYRHSKTGAWTHEYAKARTADWERAPVWDYPDGCVAWVEACGEEVALSQFPHSAPVFLNERMLDNWVARKTSRMEEIKYALENGARADESIRRLYFEQRTKACAPAFGDACPYRPCCWNASINAAPLASGIYEERVPHHQIETNALADRGKLNG